MLAQLRRCTRRFKSGEKKTGETTVTTETKDKVDALIRDDGCITTGELSAAVRIGKPSVITIIRELGYRKFAEGG
jgi:phage antirepressor YoqD-like protein